MVDIWEKTIPNHKPQGHARGVRRKFRKNDYQLKYFTVKGSTWEACTVTQPIAMIFATQILHSIKVLVLC